MKKEIEELRTRLSFEKKKKEELQVCLVTQKKELEVGFIAQKKKLEVEYQKQVDEMYFGYRCCMKKNGIMHDIPPIPSDDEGKIPGGPPR